LNEHLYSSLLAAHQLLFLMQMQALKPGLELDLYP
jgi:hypothetical protein